MIRTIRSRNYAGAFHGAVLATIFALFGVLFVTFESWIPAMEVKAGEPAPVTVRLPATYFRITLYRNTVHYLATATSTCANLLARGDVLRKGSECDGLVSAYQQQQRSRSPLHLGGLFTLYLLMGLILAGFMRHRDMGRARHLRAQIVIFVLLIATMAIAKAVLLFTGLPTYVVPVLFLPALAGYYFKRQIALAVVLITALSTASLVNFDIVVFLVLTVSGIVAVIVAKRHIHRGRTLLKAGALAGWVELLLVVVTTMIFAQTFKIHDDPAEHLDPRYSIWIASVVGGFSSGFIAFVIAPLIGWWVGEVSRSKLLDLQDLNHRLLKRIQERAPSTWEHSRAMANLAEAAANAIGGNATLVRVGAYFHDVGKSNHPDYFIENQKGGANPHDELTPDESASRIFRHVTDGTKLLRQESIPEDVVEFCYSHHGTSLLEFFWHKVMAEGNPEEFTERDFTYPGYKPSTRETGILMLVDAIEAGARTVDNPDKDTFSALVRAIVFSKLSQGQLDESGLSLEDLRIIVNTLVDTLVNMYHARIKYPWQTGDTESITKTRSSSAPPPPEDTTDTDAQADDDETPSKVAKGRDGSKPPAAKPVQVPGGAKSPFPKADKEAEKIDEKKSSVSPTAVTMIKTVTPNDSDAQPPLNLKKPAGDTASPEMRAKSKPDKQLPSDQTTLPPPAQTPAKPAETADPEVVVEEVGEAKGVKR